MKTLRKSRIRLQEEWHTERNEFPDAGESSQEFWKKGSSSFKKSGSHCARLNITSIIKTVFIIMVVNVVAVLVLTIAYIVPEVRHGMDLFHQNIYEGMSIIIINAVLFMFTLTALSLFATSLCLISIISFLFRFNAHRPVSSSLPCH
jgi:hypothetical protein